MSHLSPEALWAYAAREGGAKELADAAAHLETCAACKQQLEQVTFAQGLLKPPGEPPPLSDASARRIGHALAEAAEAQAIKRLSWRGWWAWRPLLLAAAAALLMWFLWPAQSAAPLPPVALPEPAPHQAAPFEEPQGEAQVTSARKAKGADGALATNQTLRAGAKVSTEAGGALWLELPDGTRAGLSAQSEVTLEAMGKTRVALEVKKGNLLVVAKHDPARALHVFAGEVEVRDVGTRFLVARDEKRVAVAVEEGAVEVRVGQKVVPLAAGQGVEIARGRMRELPLQAPKVERPTRVAPAMGAKAETLEAGTEVASARPVIEDLPPVRPEAPDAGTIAAATTAPADKDGGTPAVRGTPPPEEPLESIGFAFKKFGEALARPFMPSRAMLADRIDSLATDGNCDDVQTEARAWLGKDAGTGMEETQLRQVVLRAQLRCYTRSGKTTEADAIRQQLPP